MFYQRHNRVEATHRPTGIKAVMTGYPTSCLRMKPVVMALVRSLVNASPPPTQLVRSYILDGPWIKDCRTGRRFEGEAVVNAVLDRGVLEAVRPELKK